MSVAGARLGFSHFFIARPVFACAICVFITLIGLIAYPRLAVDQYPPIAPPSHARTETRVIRDE